MNNPKRSPVRERDGTGWIDPLSDCGGSATPGGAAAGDELTQAMLARGSRVTGAAASVGAAPTAGGSLSFVAMADFRPERFL